MHGLLHIHTALCILPCGQTPPQNEEASIRPEFVSWDSPLCQARGPHTLHDRDMLQSRVESCCPIRPCSAHWLLRRARPVQTHDHRRELPCKAANLFCCPCRARRGDTDALVSFPTCRARLGRPERGCRTPNQRTSEPAKQRTTYRYELRILHSFAFCTRGSEILNGCDSGGEGSTSPTQLLNLSGGRASPRS